MSDIKQITKQVFTNKLLEFVNSIQIDRLVLDELKKTTKITELSATQKRCVESQFYHLIDQSIDQLIYTPDEPGLNTTQSVSFSQSTKGEEKQLESALSTLSIDSKKRQRDDDTVTFYYKFSNPTVLRNVKVLEAKGDVIVCEDQGTLQVKTFKIDGVQLVSGTIPKPRVEEVQKSNSDIVVFKYKFSQPNKIRRVRSKDLRYEGNYMYGKEIDSSQIKCFKTSGVAMM